MQVRSCEGSAVEVEGGSDDEMPSLNLQTGHFIGTRDGLGATRGRGLSYKGVVLTKCAR